MSCRFCCWIRAKWFKLTGVERLTVALNMQIDQAVREVTADYAKLFNQIESNHSEFRKSVKDRFKSVDQGFFQTREWADRMAEGKCSPQRERIADMKVKIQKLEVALAALDSETETHGIRITNLELPHPEKIKG